LALDCERIGFLSSRRRGEGHRVRRRIGTGGDGFARGPKNTAQSATAKRIAAEKIMHYQCRKCWTKYDLRGSKVYGADDNEKLGEVDAQLQVTAREWDDALDRNADDVARRKIMGRLNELLNRRSYVRNLVVNVAKELGEA